MWDTNESMPCVKREIRSFIVGNFLFGQDQDLSDDTSFLDKGFIDSTGVLELVAHLEETYDIKVNDDELIPDNLDTIESIAAYIARKLNGNGISGRP
jgi:acyl carrier protein